jgi:hypothetical protein
MAFPDTESARPPQLADGLDSLTTKDLQDIDDTVSAVQTLVGVRPSDACYGSPRESAGKTLEDGARVAQGQFEITYRPLGYAGGREYINADGELITYTSPAEFMAGLKIYFLPDKSDSLFREVPFVSFQPLRREPVADTEFKDWACSHVTRSYFRPYWSLKDTWGYTSTQDSEKSGVIQWTAYQPVGAVVDIMATPY